MANRKIRCPIIEVEDLLASELSLAAKFSYDEYQAEDIDQSGMSGQGSLQHVIVSRSSLAESRIAELELMDVVFRDVVLANASWNPWLARHR